MATVLRVDVRPELLVWASKRCGLDEKALAKDRDLKSYPLWVRGERKPTFRQIEKFADKAQVAIGKLLLSKPPEEEFIPIEDFRSVGNRPVKDSINLFDTVHHCLARQAWYCDHLISERMDPLDIVGSANLSTDFKKVAEDIRAELALDYEQHARLSDWDVALERLVAKTEAAGIMVMRSNIVGNKTSRKLRKEDFRGFALADEYAPLIFINSDDDTKAQIFTLAHELAHIWLGKTGISKPDILKPGFANNSGNPREKTERWCNRVAGELLVPAHELNKFIGDSDFKAKNAFDKARLLSEHFKVSLSVAIRRLYDEKDIGFGEFNSCIGNMRKMSKTQTPKKKNGGGGNTYHAMKKRLGESFSHALVNSTLYGDTTCTRALWLLSIRNMSQFDKYVKFLNSR